MYHVDAVYRSLRLFTVSHELKNNCADVNSQDHQRHVVLMFRIRTSESVAPLRKTQRRARASAKVVTSQFDSVRRASSNSILGGEQNRQPVDFATSVVLTACCSEPNPAGRSELGVIPDQHQEMSLGDMCNVERSLDRRSKII